MQTSFMHPPFGFALFYLRGIAPPVDQDVRTSTGARIPWVVLQIILVVIVIFWPGSVTYWLDKPDRRRSHARSIADRDRRCLEMLPPLDFSPRRRPSGIATEKAPETTAGARIRSVRFDCLGPRAHADHEAVEAELGHLQPLVRVAAERPSGCRSSFLNVGLVCEMLGVDLCAAL